MKAIKSLNTLVIIFSSIYQISALEERRQGGIESELSIEKDSDAESATLFIASGSPSGAPSPYPSREPTVTISGVPSSNPTFTSESPTILNFPPTGVPTGGMIGKGKGKGGKEGKFSRMDLKGIYKQGKKLVVAHAVESAADNLRLKVGEPFVNSPGLTASAAGYTKAEIRAEVQRLHPGLLMRISTYLRELCVGKH